MTDSKYDLLRAQEEEAGYGPVVKKVKCNVCEGEGWEGEDDFQLCQVCGEWVCTDHAEKLYGDWYCEGDCIDSAKQDIGKPCC